MRAGGSALRPLRVPLLLLGLVLKVCIGSAIQAALVLAPPLVLTSRAIGQPMTLVFPNPLDRSGRHRTACALRRPAAL